MSLATHDAHLIERALVTIARAFVFVAGYKYAGKEEADKLVREFKKHEA